MNNGMNKYKHAWTNSMPNNQIIKNNEKQIKTESREEKKRTIKEH